MAKFTPFLGNISGKLNATIFASGKGGAYIRSFRPPTNPSTFAQIRARAGFGASSRAWSSVMSNNKAAWNAFAATYFSPKKPKPGVSYSGASAYTSLYNQSRALNAALASDFVLDATPTDLPITVSAFSVPELPPPGLFSAGVINTDETLSAPLTLVTIGSTLGDGEGFSFTVSIADSGIDPVTFGTPKFKALNSHEKFGFAVYCSSRIPSGSEAPAQIQSFLIGVIPPVTLVSPGVIPAGPDWSFSGLLNPNLNESKYQLAVGDDVIYSLYAVSSSGTSSLIGSQRGNIATA